MSQDNVEIVKQVMALVDSARNSDLRESLDDLARQLTDLVGADAEIDMSRRVFNPGVYYGQAGLRQLLEEIRGVWSEFRVTPERFIDAGDRVVVVEAICGRGRTSGVEVERRSASIWTIREGRVTRMQTHREPQEALDAVRLSEPRA